MTWVKDIHGSLINLNRATVVHLTEIVPVTSEIIDDEALLALSEGVLSAHEAIGQAEGTVLFTGSLNEAKKRLEYIAWLLNTRDTKPTEYWLEQTEMKGEDDEDPIF